MSREYWFTTKEGEKLRLAVPVAEIPESYASELNSVNILDKGEIVFCNGVKSGEIKIKSFFPAKEYSFCQYSGFPSPSECKEFFIKAMKSKQPLRFLVTGTNINAEYYVDRFDPSTKEGRDDIYFSLDLKEAPRLEFEKAEISEDEFNKKTLVRPSKHDTKTKKQRKHKVEKNETLAVIAGRFYGNPSKSDVIFNANKKTIKNRNILKEGMELIIP